uniref:Uncharacterized protein n=1 Tax=Picea sitchensis TaxID=3332 RepID=A0A6B9XRX5_PICSI|nr:hypothetical protein Q903MT_gene6740 [Picea sitchensis]
MLLISHVTNSTYICLPHVPKVPLSVLWQEERIPTSVLMAIIILPQYSGENLTHPVGEGLDRAVVNLLMS